MNEIFKMRNKYMFMLKYKECPEKQVNLNAIITLSFFSI